MPPGDDRRERRGRDEEEKPVAPPGKPAWIIYLSAFGIFFVLLIVTAVVGAWMGAASVPWPRPPDEEEDEGIRREEALSERLRTVRGLDLARERPPLRTGEHDQLMTHAPRLPLPGRATDHVGVETIPPEVQGELARPLILRKTDSSTLERGVREVSAPLTEAGNLGRAESIRSSRPTPRDGVASETESLEIRAPDAREPEKEPIDAIPGSTVVMPPGYTGAVNSPLPPPLEPAR